MSGWFVFFVLLIIASIMALILTRVKQKNTFVSDFLEMLGLVVGVIGIVADLGLFNLHIGKDSSNDIYSTPASVTSDPSSESNTAVEIGGVVEMGKYEQDGNSSDKEPIKWIVLDIQNDSALLISEYLLDYVAYNDEHEKVTWESCSLRKWMNEDFFNSSFSEVEKRKIKLTTIKNNDNEIYGTDGGNSTKDKIFTLSFKEAKKYLSDDIVRAYTTSYAQMIGDGDSYDSWWLRTPGNDFYSAMISSKDGFIYDNAYCNNIYEVGVRPAMWISL